MRDQPAAESSNGSALHHARRWAPWVALVVVGVAFAAWKATAERLLERRLDRTRQDLRYLLKASNEMDGDKIYIPQTREGNYLSPTFTTPIAYLRTLLVDPFGHDGELYRAVSQSPRLASFTRTIYVSRGPDGDWDIEKLPRSPRWAGQSFSPDMATYKSATTDDGPTAPWGWTLPEVEYYTLKSGARVEGTLIPDAIMLPDMEEKWRLAPVADALAYLLKHGVEQYDPTNGAYSDGDIYVFYPNWR
jgi:hypothetical protein